MSISPLLLPHGGNSYSSLFSGRFSLRPEKETWKIGPYSIPSREKDRYFEKLVVALSQEDLSNLPNLEMLAARINDVWHGSKRFETAPNDGSTIRFSSLIEPYAHLSNFEPTAVAIGDEIFCSSEQAYQTLKVREILQMPSAAAEIRKIGTNSLLAKKLADSAHASWEKTADTEDLTTFKDRSTRLLGRIVKAKFEQNRAFAEALIATNPTPLIEGTSDPFWGEGPDGTGLNYFGRILEQVRRILIEQKTQT